MASLDKRPNGTWRARWREYPGGPQKTRAFDRKVDAQRFLDSVQGRISEGSYIDPSAGRMGFLTYADEWAAAADWKITTRENSWPYIRKRLEKYVGDRPLSSIDDLALRQLQRKLSDDYARNTVLQTMAFAKAVMRSAYANGRIPRDPTINVKLPKVRADERTAVGPDDVPTRAEVLTILNAAPAQFRAAIALGIAGLRIGEVMAMSKDRIDLDTRRVTIDRQVQRLRDNTVAFVGPKAEKRREIVVPGAVALELRRHINTYCDKDVDDQLLFRPRSGDPYRRDQFDTAAWRPTLKGARMVGRFTFHALRHFCASTLLAEGAPLTAVAGHLGDTVSTVTKVYVHWLRDDREVPASVLDRVLAPALDVTAEKRHRAT